MPNPDHKREVLLRATDTGMALNLPRDDAGRRFTFSTIALYKQAFFSATNTGIETGNPQGIAAPLAPLLRAAMDKGQVSGEVYRGAWADVGTPERLAQLNASVT